VAYTGPTLQPNQTVIDHTSTGSTAGNLVGTFGQLAQRRLRRAAEAVGDRHPAPGRALKQTRPSRPGRRS
jgi:hypothetical protein